MFKKILLALIVAFSMAGCAERELTYGDRTNMEMYGIDQDKRIELFNQCLARVPVGPTAVKYNDWDELVSTCDEISKSQAKLCIANCVIKEKNITNRYL